MRILPVSIRITTALRVQPPAQRRPGPALECVLAGQQVRQLIVVADHEEGALWVRDSSAATQCELWHAGHTLLRAAQGLSAYLDMRTLRM